jgi:16S rRNA processing protein RimM
LSNNPISATDGSADWVTIALLGRPRGNRGELTAISLSGKPERFESLERVYLSGHENPFPVEEIWEHKGALVFKLGGIDSISDAEGYHGCEVRVPAAERAALDPGEYYHSDLIGCEVIDRATGRALGKVTALQDAGGGGLLVVNEGILVPFAQGLCKLIDIPNRRIEVDLPEGLLELNQS